MCKKGGCSFPAHAALVITGIMFGAVAALAIYSHFTFPKVDCQRKAEDLKTECVRVVFLLRTFGAVAPEKRALAEDACEIHANHAELACEIGKSLN